MKLVPLFGLLLVAYVAMCGLVVFFQETSSMAADSVDEPTAEREVAALIALRELACAFGEVVHDRLSRVD